jgi:hypothetical protein
MSHLVNFNSKVAPYLKYVKYLFDLLRKRLHGGKKGLCPAQNGGYVGRQSGRCILSGCGRTRALLGMAPAKTG